jgi:hypothetical protein
MSPAEELHTAVVEGRPVKRGTGEPPTKGDSWARTASCARTCCTAYWLAPQAR